MSKTALQRTEASERSSSLVKVERQVGIMDMVMAGHNNRAIVRSFGATSISKVMKSNLPTLGSLTKKYGEDKTESVTGVLIQEASVYFGDKFSDDMAVEVGAEVVQKYNWMKLEDVFVCLNRLKEKDIKGRLTLNKILTEMKRYANERMNIAASENYNEHLRLKESRGNAQAEQRWLDQFRSDVKSYQVKETYRKECEKSSYAKASEDKG